MTMLDRMRRHKGWLKWSLALVVLAFIALYFPDFLSQQQSAGAAPTAAVAEVDGRKITVAEFTRAYYQRVDAYRAQAGESFDPNLLKQLGVDRQILSLLIDEQATLAEAERLGLRVTDAEVRERILRLPGLQENGQFIGEERYRQLLSMQRPPLTPAEFEADVRSQLLAEKLRSALTSWMTVPDEDVDREYRRRNEKAKLELVSFAADTFTGDAAPSDKEVAAYFEKNREKYRFGVKMKIRYLAVDVPALRNAITVSPQEAQQHYKDNIKQYSTPEQVRASHVLLETEGEDEAKVRKQAEGLLAQIKKGADIAAIAKKYSDDPGSKDKGGDLGYFGRGAMVKEFDDVAFSLKPGQISDLVKSQYGFHIIKVVDKKPAATQPLKAVQNQILEQLKWQRAQARADELSKQIAPEIKQPSDLDAAAKKHGLQVRESNFFEREDPIEGIGPAPEVAKAAFSLPKGQVSGALRASQGYVFISVVDNQPARTPKLSEVQARVKEDLTRQKARDLARAKAKSVLASFKDNFAAAAKRAKVKVETTDFTRGANVPGVG
ncbi:MAG: SurA N-terminal domain-containing protein, partial [Vicinamibacteraceae bacterium]